MRKVSFPWKIFRRFFLLILAQALVLLLAAFVLHESKTTTMELYDLWQWVLVAFAVLTSAFVAWQIARPFQQTLKKAVRVYSKKSARALFGEDAFLENVQTPELGEFSELELVLDQIEEKLKRRKVQLAVERQELDALLGAIEHAILTVDLQFKVLHFNSEFATHFLSREQIRDHAEEKALTLESLFRDPKVIGQFQQAVQQRKVVKTQLRLQSFMQEMPKVFAVTVSPIRDERSKETTGLLALFHDLSEEQKAEKIRVEFVENASHELRTPLTSVKGYLETLKEDIEGQKYEQVPHFLGVVMRNVDRLSELVNDLLTLSSLEHSSEFHFEEFNLVQVTQDVLERLSNLAAQKKVQLKAQVQVESMFGDEKKIVHVLTNLVGNAIKYIPEGGEVQVRWEPFSVSETSEEGGVLSAASKGCRLRIVDNGPGIAEEHHQRLFERFYRIDRGRSRDAGGTGLGLAIVKHIVLHHGGTVRIVSEIGKGAEFICEFPITTQREKNSRYGL